jgi:serine/threonine protein kinase
VPVAAATSWGFAQGDEIVPGRSAVQLLGGGSRYEAYLVWDEVLHALAVAKILRPAFVDHLPARRALVREVDTLAELAHPAVVRSFGSVVGGERPHILLEHLDGPRLSTLIRRHGVILEQVLPLALELSSALHYVHARGFVHLDVKPRNVIMTGPPRLIDFSVALRLEALTDVGSPIGTDAYMAPEQCDPERFHTIGPASDVWGLGVTLYEALDGELPFPRGAVGAGVPLEERYPQLRGELRPPRGDVPEEVARAVLECLAPRPEDRPLSRDLAETLEPLVDALPRPRLGRFRPGWRARRSVFAGR